MSHSAYWQVNGCCNLWREMEKSVPVKGEIKRVWWEESERVRRQFTGLACNWLPENLVYSLFHKGSGSIWRECCPCPRRQYCPFGAQCCFEREPLVLDHSFNNDEIRQTFFLLKVLFSGAGGGRRRKPKQAAEVAPTLTLFNSPSGEEQQQYQVSVVEYAHSLGIGFATHLCTQLYANAHWQERCRQRDAGAAHTFWEMLRLFEDPRVQQYYAYWSRIERIENPQFIPPREPLQLRHLAAPDYCPLCQCRHWIQGKLSLQSMQGNSVATRTVGFKLPTIIITCRFCRTESVHRVFLD
jgi:hypothetical protein